MDVTGLGTARGGGGAGTLCGRRPLISQAWDPDSRWGAHPRVPVGLREHHWERRVPAPLGRPWLVPWEVGWEATASWGPWGCSPSLTH